MLTSRGVKVWPDGQPETYRGDQFRCRLVAAGGGSIGYGDVAAVLGRIAQAGLKFAQTESLHSFDGERGYSLGQGE
jgi:isocitrate dehydrogenase